MAATNEMALLMLFSMILIPSCRSFPGGAPSQACSNLTPQHSANAQSSPIPYNLTVSGLVDSMPIYIPGQTYTVTLGIANPGIVTPMFRGFLIQLRSASDNSILGGVSIGNSSNVQLHACSPNNGGVTHTNNVDKSSISFQWTPQPDTGSVLFRYTVVQTMSVFWVGASSAMLQQAETEPSPGPTGLRFSPDGPNYVIEQSREFTLECVFENGPPLVMLSLIFVGNNTVVSTANNTGSITLRFSNISPSDAGLYICTATYELGVSINITANLSVIAADVSEPAVEVNLRVTVRAPIDVIPGLGLALTRNIPQSAVGIQIINCFVPNGCIDAIIGTNVSRVQCDVRSFPAINDTSNLSFTELRILVQNSTAMLLQNASNGTFQTAFVIDDPNARPTPIVTTESGEVTDGMLTIEPRRRRVARCLPDQSSSQLIQDGSPVVGNWFLTEPGAIVDEMTINGFANSIANRSPCSISQVPRTKRQLPVAIVEESLNTINVFGDEMDINITCIVVGEFGFDSRTVTVSTILPSGPFMSAIFRFFASFSEPGGLLLGRRQVEEGNALLGIASSQVLDLIPESDPGIQIVVCAIDQEADMDMNATALECNFVSFDTTEAQFMQSIGVITAGLTNDSLPSFNISTETVEGFCPNETTNLAEFGNYNWPLTGRNQTVQLSCAFGPAVRGGLAIRQCLTGLIWAPVDFSQCRDGLPDIMTKLFRPSPVLNPGFNIVVDEGRFVEIRCTAANSVAGVELDSVAWYRINSNGSEELVPPVQSFISNFVDVNNPNNTDPASLAQQNVMKALRPGVSLDDSARRLYTMSSTTQTQTVNLTSQSFFTTSPSIGGQYVCRARNSVGARNVTYNITVARAIGEFSPVYLRATSQFPPEFQGNLFIENVEFLLLELINVSSSPGIETVSCSPATPRIDNLSPPQVEVECVIREYPPVPTGILSVGNMILNLIASLIVPGSGRASVVGFCNAETIDGGPRRMFRWNETEVGTSASARCFFGPANATVTRTCLSPNNLSPAMIEICRTEATAQFLELQNVNISQENVLTVLDNLTSVVITTNETVDQNTDTIRVVQIVIVQAASIVQSPAITQQVVEDTTRNVVMILDNVEDWPQDVVQQENNQIVEAFNNITRALIDQVNFTNISVNTMDILLRAERISSDMFQGRTFAVRDLQGNVSEIDNTMESSASISIPRDILPGQDITIAFIFYRESSLFPVTTTPPTNIDRTVVGSSIIGAQVGGVLDGMMLNSSIRLTFILNNVGTPEQNEIATPRCAFWNFSNGGFWSTEGCNLTLFNETTNEVNCECDHLTNFACLVDISARTTVPEALPSSYRLALEIMSYVGVVLSLLGLIILFITYLVFKKLRQKDVTKFHVQLALSMILMLIVFVAGINRTENRPGCITVGVLLHYLILVTWMWMAAEAVLLFQKLVIVFMKVSLKYIIVLSIICWAAPIVPVVIPVAVNPDYYITLPQNQTGAPGFCFINHIGVFFGAFLGPIFLIILFNLIVFIIVITVLVRHNISRNKRKMKDSQVQIPPKETCKLILSLSGIMTLLGLTWVLSIFTSVGTSTNRDASFALQFLFVFFNSLQGFFLFVFFVILSADARNAWLSVLCPCIKSSEPHTSKSHLRYTGNTSSTGKTNTYSGNIYATTGTLEAAVRKEDLKMHSVAPIDEENEDEIDLPPLAPLEEKVIEEKPKLESEQPQGKQLRARVKRVSTKKRTHHVETAEFDFTDDFSDDDDDFP